MDEKTYDEQLAQLDPKLRARLEAWREEHARTRALLDARSDAGSPLGLQGDDAAGLRELMEEPAGGEDFGRVKRGGPFTTDGDERVDYGRDMSGGGTGKQPKLWRSLEDTDARRLRHGDDVPGWQVAWREPTGFPAGRPRAVDGKVTRPELLAALRRLVGWDFDDFERVAGDGRRRRDPEERLRLARDVARVAARAHGRGAVKWRARAYDCHPKTIQRLCREAREVGQST
jgi:hypothetical protein